MLGGTHETLHVFYDGGCGVCGACAAWAIGRDRGNRLRFFAEVGDADIPGGYARADFETLCETTVVAWEPGTGRTYTRHLAIARVLDGLPFGWLLSWPLKLPLASPVFGLLYDAFARRRHRVSQWLGMGVCKLPDHGPSDQSAPGASNEGRPNSPPLAR